MRNQKYIKRASIGTELISSSQAFTDSWAAVGGEINVQDYDMITFWLEQTADTSINLQFKVVLLRVSGGTEYSLPILSPDANKIRYQPEYYELDVDAVNVDIVERFCVSEASHVKLYIKAGTVGGSAGTLDSVYYDLSTAVA